MGKREYPGKNLYEQSKEPTDSTYDSGSGNQTCATLDEGKCFHHCANLALYEHPQNHTHENRSGFIVPHSGCFPMKAYSPLQVGPIQYPPVEGFKKKKELILSSAFICG